MPCRKRNERGLAGFRRNRGNVRHIGERSLAQRCAHSRFDLFDRDAAPAADAERERCSRRSGRRIRHVGLSAGARRHTCLTRLMSGALGARTVNWEGARAQVAARA
jgi:hypothetical protein